LLFFDSSLCSLLFFFQNAPLSEKSDSGAFWTSEDEFGQWGIWDWDMYIRQRKNHRTQLGGHWTKKGLYRRSIDKAPFQKEDKSYRNIVNE